LCSDSFFECLRPEPGKVPGAQIAPTAHFAEDPAVIGFHGKAVQIVNIGCAFPLDAPEQARGNAFDLKRFIIVMHLPI
jgi:hypothetical protein